MAREKIDFYLRHRRQIAEWAELEKRADELMRDAVNEGSQDKAAKLLKGESGDAEVDFYMRNRVLITEWDALQILAGKALHTALLASAQAAGFRAREGKRGWTTVRSSEFEKLRGEQRVSVELAWTQQDLLSTRRGYPYPRLALELHPDTWKGERRDMLVRATRPVAHGLGMKKKDNWWVHWRMLDELRESQDLQSYADECVASLAEASERFQPVLVDGVSTAPVDSDPPASSSPAD